MSESGGLSAEEVLAYLAGKSEPTAEPPPGQVQAYREAAAVLVAVPDPESLQPIGGEPATGAVKALLGDELVPATGEKFGGGVMLTPGVRAETIRELVSTGRIEDALAANAAQPKNPLQAHFELYLRHDAPPLDHQSLGELEATRQVSLWLSGIVDGVPTVEEVDARAGYRKLLELFETLAGDAVFHGRGKEMDQLRNYIGVVSPETTLGRVREAFKWAEPQRQPAVSVSGVGGAGKSSLVARFMLEHARLPEDRRVPFGYLDFARSTLDIGDQLGLCLELLRQLDLQFPGDGHFADIRYRALQLDLQFPGDGRSPDILNQARLQRTSVDEPAPEAKSGNVTELRVHGVSGSPPGAILGDLAPELVSGDAVAGFYRTNHRASAGGRAASRDVEVYSWGGLTSRSKVRVLWLALLPFLLANLAGWMCSARTRHSTWRFRLHRLAFGLGALALTVNAILIAVMISADVIGYRTTRAGLALHQWWLAPLSWEFIAGHPARQVALGILVVLLFVLALLVLAVPTWRYEAVRPPYRVGVSHRDRARTVTAAALRAGPADDEFWDGGSSVRLLTWVHFSVILGFLAMVLGVTVKELVRPPHAVALGWAAIALGATTVALGAGYIVLDALTTPPMDTPGTAPAPGADWRALSVRFHGGAAYLLLPAAAALVAAGLFAWLQPGAPLGLAAELPGMASVTGWTALAIAVVLVIALISVLLGLGGSRRTLIGGSCVTLMLAFGLLNTVMLAAEIWVAHLVGPVTSDAATVVTGLPGKIYLPYVITSWVPLVAWAAVLAVVAFAEIEMVRWMRARQLPTIMARRYQEQAAAFRNQLTGPRKYWYWSGLRPFAPPGIQTKDPGTGWWEQRVARAQFLGRATHDAAWLLGAIIAGQVVVAFCIWQLHVQPPVVIRNLGVGLVGLALPTLMAFLYAAWNNPAKSRTIGILWDVGTFWPRSYHPLSPPCYTERAIPELQRRMWWLHDNGGHVVLVAHGQGSVLAAAALIQPGCRSPDDQPTLITLGSPADKIYGWAFPAYFGPQLLSPLEHGGDGRLKDWRNFYYPTDPIGGPVASGLAAAGGESVDTMFLDPAECYYLYGQPPPAPRGHSGYWADPRVRDVIKGETQPGNQLGDRLIAARDLLADALERMSRVLGPRPYVVVLDTFEEVQYRGEPRAIPLWEMLAELQERAPFLRVVVAGRAPVDSLELAGKQPSTIVIGELDEASAMAFLGAQGITDQTLQVTLVQTFGRLPLTLKLVGALAGRTPGGAAALLSPTSGGLSLLAASDEVIQGQLYGRLLDQIADERVRRLAHPGLVLRRINPALIFEVLNEPCGLGIRNVIEAQDIFEELQRESSLVSVDSSDGDLVHRPELRRVMLKLLLADAPALVQRIQRAAVAWYAGQDSRRSKAEELYYRLHLGEPVEDSELSDREIRSSLQAVIEEFSPEVQVRLATVGFSVSEKVREDATREQRHTALAAQIEELLPYGPSSVDRAQTVFASERGDLDSASPLFRAGARIATQSGDEKEALKLIERGLERAVREGAAALTLGLLQERAWLYRRRSRADQADGLARLGEQARRHRNRLAQLQYLAHMIDTGDDAEQRNPAALGDLLSRADPQDAWGLVPALAPAVRLARPMPQDVLLAPLRSLVHAQASPFRLAVFPDPVSRSALDALRSTGSGTGSGSFAGAFLKLCEVWPYRVLSVAAPYGRLGEQLHEA